MSLLKAELLNCKKESVFGGKGDGGKGRCSAINKERSIVERQMSMKELRPMKRSSVMGGVGR